jgi:hypothetical protein
MLQGMGRTHYPFGELHTSRLKPNPENGKQESSKYTAKKQTYKDRGTVCLDPEYVCCGIGSKIVGGTIQLLRNER